MPSSSSAWQTSQPYIPSTEVGKLPGVSIHFETFAALAAGVAQEQNNVNVIGAPLWLDATSLTNGGEPGISRRWNKSAAHARLVSFGSGRTLTLAADSNVVLIASGVPASGAGANGDVSVDWSVGVYGPKAAGAWPATPAITFASGSGSGSAGATRVAATNAIPLDSTAGKAIPLTAGQAIQITGATVITVGSNPVDGGVCVADYEVSGSLDLSACIASGAPVTPGYRYRITYEYSLLEGKPYAYVVQGSPLAQAVPAAPTLVAGTATSTAQPVTATPGAVDATHGATLAYSFYKSTDNGVTFTLAATQSSASYTFTGLAESVSYQYRATANNATGPSAPSSILTASTIAGTGPVLEFYSVPTANRDLTGSTDFYVDSFNHTGSGAGGKFTRKPGANKLTVAPFGGCAYAGPYGVIGEAWSWTGATDDTATTYDGSQNHAAGYANPNDASTVQSGWRVTTPLAAVRQGIVIRAEAYSGFVLHASLSDGSSPDIEVALPVGNGTGATRGIRFRGSPSATVTIEIRKPLVSGTPAANNTTGSNRDFGVMGAILVPA